MVRFVDLFPRSIQYLFFTSISHMLKAHTNKTLKIHATKTIYFHHSTLTIISKVIIDRIRPYFTAINAPMTPSIFQLICELINTTSNSENIIVFTQHNMSLKLAKLSDKLFNPNTKMIFFDSYTLPSMNKGLI